MKKQILGVFLMLFVSVATMSFTNIKNSESKKVEEVLAVAGCRQSGNDLYDFLRGRGYSHREARSERRAFVRWCRSVE